MAPPTRPTARPARALLAAVLVAPLALACSSVPRRPEPAPLPSTPDVPPPIEERVDPRGFHHRAGTFVYDVRNEATIEVAGDTLPADTVVSEAVVTYRITAGELETDSLPVAGTIDAWSVRSSRAAAAPHDTLVLPLPFAGVLTGDGLRLALPALPSPAPSSLAPPPPAPSPAPAVAATDSLAARPTPPLDEPCRAPIAAPVALARELLVLPPDSIAVGTTWMDTTTTTICRGEVPVTTTAVQRYTVLGSTIFEGREALAIERRSEITLGGAGARRGRTLTVRGSGTGRTVFYASTERGALLGLDGEYDTDLAVESGTRRQQFAQRARQRVRLRDR